MKIKEFNFPYSWEWIKLPRHNYITNIGHYYVETGITAWKKYSYEITLILSEHSNPLLMTHHSHLFVKKITVDRINTSDDDIRQWYHESTYKLNEFWKNYILNTYIKGD